MDKLLIILSITLMMSLTWNNNNSGYELQTDSAKHFLVLASLNPSLTKVKPGHAFIILGKEDEKKKSTVFEARGFYPKSKVKGVFSFAFETLGIIKEEENIISDYSLSLEISAETHEKIKALFVAWDSKTYTLTNRDCISFVDEVIQTIEILHAPERNKIDFPSTFLKNLVLLNADKGIVKTP